MEDYLGHYNKLNVPRKLRFTSQLLVDISSLVEMVTRKIIELSSSSLKVS